MKKNIIIVLLVLSLGSSVYYSYLKDSDAKKFEAITIANEAMALNMRRMAEASRDEAEKQRDAVEASMREAQRANETLAEALKNCKKR